ncbi:chromosome partition Smc domain protein [Mycobacteroides abscessus]|uniref:DUF3450 domain-containing protein n=1 Tax=Mycobacteroides abscessus TaxID=36809 RepID=UPI00045173DF|nr:DUF3450 domain-containing protein [Mycobacteroides abscessus]EUA66087.1 chromosome partition Smc domain protein [Mycobacteroides abscessus]
MPAGLPAARTRSRAPWKFQAAIEAAREELPATETQVGRSPPRWPAPLAEQTARQDTAEQALAALNESDAAISAVYEQLGRVGQEVRAAAEEVKKLTLQRDQLERGRATTLEELAEVESRLRNAEEAPTYSTTSRWTATIWPSSWKRPVPSRSRRAWQCAPPKSE